MYCNIMLLTTSKAVELVMGLSVLTGNLHRFPELTEKSLDYFVEHHNEIKQFLEEEHMIDLNSNEQLDKLVVGYISHKYAEETTHSDKLCTFFTQHVDENYVQIHESTQSILISSGKFELIYFARYKGYVLRKGTVSDCITALERFSGSDGTFFVVPVNVSKRQLNSRFANNDKLDIPHGKYTATFIYKRDADFILSTVPVPTKELSL